MKGFIEKKQHLLGELKTLALKHNRAYYVSIIPIVESADDDQEDLIDMYIEALDNDRAHLSQSREALKTVSSLHSLI